MYIFWCGLISAILKKPLYSKTPILKNRNSQNRTFAKFATPSITANISAFFMAPKKQKFVCCEKK